ncbi:hypothetical protein B2A_11114 [mine drainage metagenome]|uniref:ArnR1-like winged helix-turn-helix domain-containing protein n=1 Tax=mine drainage metagenome TaxID=410659 RepID=T0YVX5_9ZZZZ
MRTYRTEIAILLEILRAMDADEGTLASISRRVNVPYGRLEEYADELCRRKLAEAVSGDESSDRATRYRVTDEGRKFMTEARQFEWFLHAYGMHL